MAAVSRDLFPRCEFHVSEFYPPSVSPLTVSPAVLRLSALAKRSLYGRGIGGVDGGDLLSLFVVVCLCQRTAPFTIKPNLTSANLLVLVNLWIFSVNLIRISWLAEKWQSLLRAILK